MPSKREKNETRKAKKEGGGKAKVKSRLLCHFETQKLLATLFMRMPSFTS